MFTISASQHCGNAKRRTVDDRPRMIHSTPAAGRPEQRYQPSTYLVTCPIDFMLAEYLKGASSYLSTAVLSMPQHCASSTSLSRSIGMLGGDTSTTVDIQVLSSTCTF